MSWIKKLFSKPIPSSKPASSSSVPDVHPLVQKFASKSPDQRMGDIMILGETGEMKIFDVIRHAVMEDPDMSVRFAALKRIHKFKANPEVKTMLLELDKASYKNDLEPYLSMAMSRMELITPEESEQRLGH